MDSELQRTARHTVTLRLEVTGNLNSLSAIDAAVQACYAERPNEWTDGVHHIAARYGIPECRVELVGVEVSPGIVEWLEIPANEPAEPVDARP